jgi:tryptophanase
MFAVATLFIAFFVYLGILRLIETAFYIRQSKKEFKDISIKYFRKKMKQVYNLDRCVIIVLRDGQITVDGDGMEKKEFLDMWNYINKNVLQSDD